MLCISRVKNVFSPSGKLLPSASPRASNFFPQGEKVVLFTLDIQITILQLRVKKEFTYSILLVKQLISEENLLFRSLTICACAVDFLYARKSFAHAQKSFFTLANQLMISSSPKDKPFSVRS